MKLSETLIDIGRPVAYYPGLKVITNSTTATILLCQLLYWTGKGENKDGSIYKTAEELEIETGLTYEEQLTARRKLAQLGIIEEHYARMEHRLYFKVHTEILNTLWDKASGQNPDGLGASGQNPDGEMVITQMANKAKPISLISNTENTLPENTLPENNLSSTSDEKIYKEIPKIPKIPTIPKKPKDPRYLHIAYSAFYSITNHRPNKAILDWLIEIIGNAPDMDKLKQCQTEWIGRGYNPQSYKWLEWYRDGIPDQKGNTKTTAPWSPIPKDADYYDLIHR